MPKEKKIFSNDNRKNQRPTKMQLLQNAVRAEARFRKLSPKEESVLLKRKKREFLGIKATT